MIDYHAHSRLCRHGEGEIYEYVETAIARGLSEIGFAEHIPIPGLDDPTGRMDIEEWDLYVNDIFRAREKYPEITIRFGVEADYLPPFLDHVTKLVGGYPFDFVIGSVHFVDGWDFSNPALRHHLDEFGVDRLYRRYYELIVEAADAGLFDVIGHLDLPKKTGVRPGIDISQYVEEALQAVKRNDLALDVNTSGLRKEPKEIYPAEEILQRAFALQIPVSLGSDAHKPREIAAGFDVTIDMLQSIGYNRVCVFEKRRRTLITLEAWPEKIASKA